MSNVGSRLDTWVKMVASGTADSFFAAFPGDHELAQKLSELLPGEGVISPEQVKRDRDRFHLLPRRGDVREEKPASPTKNVILNKAQQLSVREALAEILDNILDNFERNAARPRRLEVEILVYSPVNGVPGELIVRENSGGIPGDRIAPLIQLGASDRAAGGIGAWGEGFKMAVFALGQEVEVFSTYPGEQPTAVHFPKGWLDPNHRLWTHWKVDVFGVERNPAPEGTTIVRINHLYPSALNFFGVGGSYSGRDTEAVCSDLSTYFGEIYSERYHNLAGQDHDIVITLTISTSSCTVSFLKPVRARLIENLSFLPWLRPIVWHKRLETELEDEGRTARLDITVLAGLAATEDYSPMQAGELSKPGVEMWGNGRKFSLRGRVTDESVGWGYTYGGSGGRNPTSNASYRRLTIVALFSADDSRDIPWAAPVKNDYNRRSDFYAEIQEMLARVIRLFKDAHALLEFVLLPFSQAWKTYSDERKLDILFRDTDTSVDFVDDFRQSRFGRKVLSFEAPLYFKEIDESNIRPTVRNLYDLDPTHIQDIVTAAAVTKQSGEQRVLFLKAIFPAIASQAELEEQMQLGVNEEFSL